MRNNISQEIVIINQSSGHITYDIIRAFIEQGKKVKLITGNKIQVPVDILESCQVFRIISYKKLNKYTRFITWLLGAVQILFIIKLKQRKSFLFLFSNPPFTVFVPLSVVVFFAEYFTVLAEDLDVG